MGVFKEEMCDLENFARRQIQIYPDSCDYGILATPEIKKSMGEIVRTLINLPGSKLVWKTNTPYVQRHYLLKIYWSSTEGTNINVLYANDIKRKKEYFSIDIKSFDEEN